MTESKFWEDASSAVNSIRDRFPDIERMTIAAKEAFIDLVVNWMETAARESGNRDYYRGLCLQCVDTLAGSHKERMFKTDDGGTSADPLLDRLPEVINDLSAGYHGNDKILAELHVMFDRNLVREIPAKVEGLFRERDSYKMVAEDLIGFMRECGAKMGIQGVIHNDEVKDNIVKAIAYYIRPVNTHQTPAKAGEMTRLNEFIQTVAERVGISKEERFDTGREVQLRILSNLDALKHIQDEWTKDCELIGKIHKAAGFRSGRPAEELPDFIAERLKKLDLIIMEAGPVQDGQSDAEKLRKYEEHFSQCIRILGLKPGADIPASIVVALVKSRRVQDSPLPTAAENPDGLHQRYNVSKTDGTPIDPKAVYLVLRIDNEGTELSENRVAGRFAGMAYALLIHRNGDWSSAMHHLADDILKLIGHDIVIIIFFKSTVPSISAASFWVRVLKFSTPFQITSSLFFVKGSHSISRLIL